MSDLRLPPSTPAQRLSPTPAPAPAPPAAKNDAPVLVGKAGSVGDQMVSRSLQSGQAAQTHAFLDTPAPPTAAELKWACELETKISKGYRPTEAESKAYHRIADAIDQQPIPPARSLDTPVTARDSEWAASLETRVSNGGAQPSDQELATYRNIAVRLLKADQAPALPAEVSQQEMDWAQGLQQRVKTFGYKPSPRELEAYSDIYARSQQPAAPAPKVPVSDLSWAQDLSRRIGQGYQPSEAERGRYLAIYTATQNQREVPRVSADESRWALELQQKARAGYQPSDDELDRLGEISTRLALQDPSSIRPQDRVVSQHELDWATRLQQRVRDGVPASDPELARYEAIHKRYVASSDTTTD